MRADHSLGRGEAEWATTGNGGSRWAISRLLNGLCDEMLELSASQGFESGFDQAWSEMELFVDQDVATLRCLVNVLGLTIPVNRVQFSDNLWLGTVDEVATRPSRSFFNLDPTTSPFGPELFFQSECSVKQWIREGEPIPKGDDLRLLVERSDLAVQCLALVEPSDPFILFSVLYESSVTGDLWPQRLSGRSFSIMSRLPRMATNLSHTQLDKWVDIFGKVDKIDLTMPNYAKISLRRFHESTTRLSLEDRVIDLGISSEALFLTEIRDELAFRLAGRAALWLGETPGEREEVAKAFKDFYTLRSKVVHGGPIEPSHIEGASTLTKTVTHMMRTALTRTIDWIGEGRPCAKTLMDWDRAAYRGERLEEVRGKTDPPVV